MLRKFDAKIFLSCFSELKEALKEIAIARGYPSEQELIRQICEEYVAQARIDAKEHAPLPPPLTLPLLQGIDECKPLPGGIFGAFFKSENERLDRELIRNANAIRAAIKAATPPAQSPAQQAWGWMQAFAKLPPPLTGNGFH